jgi:hypothetical protein
MSDTKICPKCGAKWIGGNHYWATGKPGNEDDLAGLVCNKLGDKTCINSKKGSESGTTWEKRNKWISEELPKKKKHIEEEFPND